MNIIGIDLGTSNSAAATVQGKPRHLELDLNRTELKRLALHDAATKPEDIDRVVFVGGPKRIPAVRSYFEGIFGHKAEMGVDLIECVAAGAAIQAGVLAAPQGVTKIEVTFDIDSNGILSVVARDLASGKSQSIHISSTTSLSGTEKNRMKEGTERYAETPWQGPRPQTKTTETGAEPRPSGSGPHGKVVDAEYRESI